MEARLFKFETVVTFTIVSVGNNYLFLLHANITRYFYFLVTKGNLTLVFHKRVNSIKANKSSAPVPTRCLHF